MLKRLMKLFSCKSECNFNPKELPEEMMSDPWHLDDFELKDKDLKRLYKIFVKRKKSIICEQSNGACETIV